MSSDRPNSLEVLMGWGRRGPERGWQPEPLQTISSKGTRETAQESQASRRGQTALRPRPCLCAHPRAYVRIRRPGWALPELQTQSWQQRVSEADETLGLVHSSPSSGNRPFWNIVSTFRSTLGGYIKSGFQGWGGRLAALGKLQQIPPPPPT